MEGIYFKEALGKDFNALLVFYHQRKCEIRKLVQP